MCWWEDDRGLHTAEFMVVTEAMPDFCGGLLIYSPRVEVHTKGAWGEKFACPGNYSEEKTEFSVNWPDFDRETMAIDLAAFTGQTEWDEMSVREYGEKCIAAKIAGVMYAQGKRGFVASDSTSGRLTRMCETMVGLESFITTNAYDTEVGFIKNEDGRIKPQRRIHNCVEVSMDVDFGEEWYNSNSGSNVHWVTGNMHLLPVAGETVVTCCSCGSEYDISDSLYHSECPECGYDENQTIVPVEVDYGDFMDVISSQEYRQRAKRFYWRNG
jgi:hypothetical protein